MTTILDIANRTMQALGTRTTVTQAELDGLTTNEARQFMISLSPVQAWCFGLANWNFARRTGIPSRTKAVPSPLPVAWNPAYPAPPWLYEYALPTDFIRATYVTNSDPGDTGWLGEPRRFVIASNSSAANSGAVLLTNEASPVLIYTANINDPNYWPWYFERLVCLALAQASCLTLTGDMKLYAALTQSMEQQISIATQVNTAEGLVIADSTPEWIQALGINYPFRRIDGPVPQTPQRSRGGNDDGN